MEFIDQHNKKMQERALTSLALYDLYRANAVYGQYSTSEIRPRIEY